MRVELSEISFYNKNKNLKGDFLHAIRKNY